MWTISRQLQWPNGDCVVEISSGGLDFCNPDALCKKYPGELKEFRDPREAVQAAIRIAQAWQADTGEAIQIAHGYTGGMTLPFEGEAALETTFKKLEQWAEEAYEKLPKCGQCSEILAEDELDRYANQDLLWGEEFCSERCLETAAEAVLDEDPKCSWCGKPLPADGGWGIKYDDDLGYCSEQCAQAAFEEYGRDEDYEEEE